MGLSVLPNCPKKHKEVIIPALNKVGVLIVNKKQRENVYWVGKWQCLPQMQRMLSLYLRTTQL